MAAMQQGLGGYVVGHSGIRQFSSPSYTLVALDDPDAPQWEVGIIHGRDSSKKPIVDDFVAFTRNQLTERP